MAAHKAIWILISIAAVALICRAEDSSGDEAVRLIEQVLDSTTLTPEQKAQQLANYGNQELVLDFGDHGESTVGQWAEMCALRSDRCDRSILDLNFDIPEPARHAVRPEYKQLKDYCLANLREYCRGIIDYLGLIESSRMTYKQRQLLISLVEYYEQIEAEDQASANGGPKPEEDKVNKFTYKAYVKLKHAQYGNRIVFVREERELLRELNMASGHARSLSSLFESLQGKDGKRLEPKGDILVRKWDKVGKIAQSFNQVVKDHIERNIYRI